MVSIPSEPADRPDIVDRVRFDDRGLVPVVVQEATTHEVLMMAWADAEALAHTVRFREGAYWSRSRQELWIKGATSGHRQHVRDVRLDCDGDTVLYVVDQQGAACHTGERTCFFTTVLTPDASRSDTGPSPQGADRREADRQEDDR